MTRKNLAANIYLFFATTALIMFYFAHAPWIVEKLFYVPCAGALLSSFFCHFKRDKIDSILLMIIICSLLSDLTNFTAPNSIDSPWLRQCIGILCFNKLRKLNLNKIVTTMSMISPIIILSLYFFSSPFGVDSYRYGGFSGDPNYFAISLNLLIAMNLIYIHRKEVTRIQAIIPIITIISTLPLFIAGKSRAGVISLIVLLSFYLIFLFIHNRKICFVVISITFMCSSQIYLLFQKNIDAFIERFDHFDSELSGGSRAIQFLAIYEVYRVHPYTFPFGTGIDNSALKFEEFRAKSPYAIHNTYLSILFAQGFITLCIFFLLLGFVYKQVKSDKHRLILIGLFLSLLLNISSVPSHTYLTFWWTIFFILSPSRDKPHRHKYHINSKKYENSSFVYLYRKVQSVL